MRSKPCVVGRAVVERPSLVLMEGWPEATLVATALVETRDTRLEKSLMRSIELQI